MNPVPVLSHVSPLFYCAVSFSSQYSVLNSMCFLLSGWNTNFHGHTKQHISIVFYSLIFANLDKRQAKCGIWGSHSGGYEEFYLLECNAVYSVESQGTFRGNISPLGGWQAKCFLSLAFMLVSYLAYCFSTLKLEATCSFETSFNFRRTTRIYISEDRTLRKRKYFELNGSKNLSNLTCYVQKVQTHLKHIFRSNVYGVKQLGGEAAHSPPSTAEINNWWIYITNPSYIFKKRKVLLFWNLIGNTKKNSGNYIKVWGTSAKFRTRNLHNPI
jgi:hypothetical protein